MSFKKLIPHLQETLPKREIEDFYPFQKKVISAVKAGQSLFLTAPTGSGKTSVLIWSVIQKLKGEAFEDSPRAIILVENKEKALELEEAFRPWLRGTDLRLFSLYDERKIQDQIDEVYVGVDIVIATVPRLAKIYFLNGIHLGQLKILAFEDARFLRKGLIKKDVVRLSLSLEKCQYFSISEKMEPHLEELGDDFMNRAVWVKG